MTDNENGTYKITILFKNGARGDVLASRDLCEAAREEWVNAVLDARSLSADPDKPAKPITIHGMFDSADRAEQITSFLPNEVVSVTVLRFY